MKSEELSIVSGMPDATNDILSDILKSVGLFNQVCQPLEKAIRIFVDLKTGARYCECHIHAKNLLKLSTTDVPLDPEEQAEYRANRAIVEDDVAFAQMKADAKDGRTFSNIVAEFDISYDKEHPIKIIGGQHRFIAIREAAPKGVNVPHGLKVYFGLSKDQRLDVQLISNSNIDASSDLYDRLQETANGPELRNWCQEVGFLDKGRDFSSKRQRSSPITVRTVRSFIVNFYRGKDVGSEDFENTNTTPIFCSTGKPDRDWDELRGTITGMWSDEGLKTAASEFVLLDQAQRSAIQEIYAQDGDIPLPYAEKALSFAITTAWAYVAGVLQTNPTRLKRHFALRNAKGKDPLNAEAMAKGRHKSDPENYRGLGTRNDVKERGRCVELFYYQAESGKGITPNVIDVAIKRHFTKQAKLDQIKAEKKV